jgi:hypothetical protein
MMLYLEGLGKRDGVGFILSLFSQYLAPQLALKRPRKTFIG